MGSKIKYLLLLLFLSSAAFAQLKEFEIIPEEPPAMPPVFPSYSKKAALIIHSSIPTLKFVSNTGGIVANLSRPNEGKYILIVEPENQYITVKTSGFRESKFPITGLQPRDALYYTIEQKQEIVTEQGRLVLNSIPDGAHYQVAGFPISGTTPADFPIAVGNYKIVFSKPGYKDKEIIVEVGKGEVIPKTVELELGLEIIENNVLTQISEVRTIGGYLNGARVEIEPDALVIVYNLNGPADEEYDVTLKVKSKLDKDYEYEPQLLIGDYGEGSFAGSGRRIKWKVNEEVPGGFDTQGLYLELTAETVGGRGWFWWTSAIVGVVAALVGVVVIPPPPPPPSSSIDIPSPPVRP